MLFLWNKTMKQTITTFTLAMGLFLGLIGFNPALAFDYQQYGTPVRDGEPMISPGDWSGTLEDRLTQLGYEIASINVEAGEVTVALASGEVLWVDIESGAFSVDDSQGNLLYGSVNYDQTIHGIRFAADVFTPDEAITLDGWVLNDTTTDGGVVVPYTANGQHGAEWINLRSLSTGTTLTEPRLPGYAPANCTVQIAEGLRGFWAVVLFVVTVVVVVFLSKECTQRFIVPAINNRQRNVPI